MYVFTPPPSKSLSNRALILASLVNGKSVINNFSFCDDTNYMIKSLRKLGVEIVTKNNSVEVFSLGGNFSKSGIKIYCGNAGTTFRFLTALLSLNKGKVVLDGSKRMRQRPIKSLVKALEQAGVEIKSSKNFPPIIIKGGNNLGGKIKIDASESSQFLSALLMILPFMSNGSEIHVDSGLVSKPYVDLTLAMQKQFGVIVKNVGYKKFTLGKNQKYQPSEISIEPDASSASYFLAAAAIAKKTLRVKELGQSSLQADLKFVDLLAKMGCEIKKSKSGIIVKGKNLRGISVDLNSSPDIVQTLAVTACFAEGKTKIRNVHNLRLKETDRLHALSIELRKIGAEVKEFHDGLEITPGKILPTEISTYNDHRMAMSFALASLMNPKIKIRNPKCVKKSFPNFWSEFNNMKRAFKL
ncbi:MAG: 3-phosphoshikimate 1-carboxyvinyltransferase [Bacteroidetes bacterium]|nr:3-phosphoshikimate 1-carboxyvinyltransferase [Bacteroidota bacterium]